MKSHPTKTHGPVRESTLVAFALAIIVASLLTSPASAQTDQAIVIKAGHMLDVASGQLIPDATIVVRGERIESAGTGLPIPAGARVIDLSDHVVLPGLIDAHTHVCLQPGYSEANPILTKSIPYRTVEAVNAVRATLEAGFTTIRDIDAEGADWADVAVRDGIYDGIIAGPRMQVAALAISITGGHMNQTGLAPQIDVPQFGAIANTPSELVGEVRHQIKYGTDWIKLYATGTLRHINPETLEPLTQYSYDEIKLVVDEATRFGIPVAAHAYGGRGATDAVRAGVRSIEHGFFLDDETLDLMVKKGTYWVPTIAVYMPQTPRNEWSPLFTSIVEGHERTFRKAVAKGVRIAYGTDAGALPHGDNAIDFKWMVDYGMTPLAAVQSATIVAADLMGLSGDIGTLAPGSYADIVAVPSSPIDDISVLADVRFVMKGGEVVKNVGTSVTTLR